MSIWWYSDGRSKTKISFEQIADRLESGQLTAETLFWSEGMTAWQPLGEISDLAPLLHSVPPPLPSRDDSEPPSRPPRAKIPAGPWARYFARWIDLSWEILALAFAFGYALPFFPGVTGLLGNAEVSGAVSGLALTIVLTPIALGFDAIVYLLAGNTPGKAILGISVRNADLSRLRVSRYAHRNMTVWAHGLFFGIPFVSLISLYGQYHNLKKNGSTDYDLESEHVVEAYPIVWWRVVIASAVCLMLFSVTAVMQSLSRQSSADLPEVSKKPPVVEWQNPTTKRVVAINEKWHFSQAKASDGKPIYTFVLNDESALVLLATEELRGVNIDRYGWAIRKSLANYIRFSENGQIRSKQKLPSWYVEGILVEDSQSKCTMEVSQIDTVFWRVITIQHAPHDRSTAAVWAIRDALWESVLGKI